MSKGRSTTVISVRLSDETLIRLQERAAKKGLPCSVLARQLIQKELGLPLK